MEKPLKRKCPFQNWSNIFSIYEIQFLLQFSLDTLALIQYSLLIC